MSKSRFVFDKFAKLIEQGLVNYKDISEELVNILKSKRDEFINRMQLVSKEEYDEPKNKNEWVTELDVYITNDDLFFNNPSKTYINSSKDYKKVISNQSNTTTFYNVSEGKNAINYHYFRESVTQYKYILFITKKSYGNASFRIAPLAKDNTVYWNNIAKEDGDFCTDSKKCLCSEQKWEECGDHGDLCKFDGLKRVRYGSDNKNYEYTTSSEQIQCYPSNFIRKNNENTILLKAFARYTIDSFDRKQLRWLDSTPNKNHATITNDVILNDNVVKGTQNCKIDFPINLIQENHTIFIIGRIISSNSDKLFAQCSSDGVTTNTEDGVTTNTEDGVTTNTEDGVVETVEAQVRMNPQNNTMSVLWMVNDVDSNRLNLSEIVQKRFKTNTKYTVRIGGNRAEFRSGTQNNDEWSWISGSTITQFITGNGVMMKPKITGPIIINEADPNQATPFTFQTESYQEVEETTCENDEIALKDNIWSKYVSLADNSNSN